jgi:hypothetical protein
MQSFLSQGIVVRNYRCSKNKIIVFDEREGKITGFLRTFSLQKCPQGGLISYRLEAWHQWYRLHDIELHKLPADWVRDDLLFLHHVLELIAYFVQPAQSNKELFVLCETLYHSFNDDRKHLLFFKKLFLCKLFIVLGMYTEPPLAWGETLFALISPSSNSILHDQYDELLDKKIGAWLYSCLQAHIGKTHLKTFDFLVKVGADEKLYAV